MSDYTNATDAADAGSGSLAHAVGANTPSELSVLYVMLLMLLVFIVTVPLAICVNDLWRASSCYRMWAIRNENRMRESKRLRKAHENHIRRFQSNDHVAHEVDDDDDDDNDEETPVVTACMAVPKVSAKRSRGKDTPGIDTSSASGAPENGAFAAHYVIGHVGGGGVRRTKMPSAVYSDSEDSDEEDNIASVSGKRVSDGDDDDGDGARVEFRSIDIPTSAPASTV
jgi:hypothetical protein